MKKKDLISKIRDMAIEEMPDVLDKIDINRIAIEDEPETIKTPLNLRRVLSYTFASLFILISGFTVFNFIGTGTDTSPLGSSTEIVGFQTVSAASLLESFELIDLSNVESTTNVTLLSETTTSVDEDPLISQLNMVNNYLNMAETVLAYENQYLYESVTSDNEAYAYAFTYKGTDLLGNLITYHGYYNIIDQNGYQVELGILIHDETTYQYESMVSGEGETLTYRYRVRVNAENYVEVSDSSDASDQRFSYRVYKNNELFNQSEISLVKNKQNLKANIQISSQSNQQITMDVERDRSDASKQQFKVNYLMNGTTPSEGNFTVSLQYNASTGQYEFQYQINNQAIVVEKRANKGNQKANDDDFTPGRSGVTNNPYVTTADDETTTDNPGNGYGTPTTEEDRGNSGSQPNTNGHHTSENSGSFELILDSNEIVYSL